TTSKQHFGPPTGGCTRPRPQVAIASSDLVAAATGLHGGDLRGFLAAQSVPRSDRARIRQSAASRRVQRTGCAVRAGVGARGSGLARRRAGGDRGGGALGGGGGGAP